MILYVDNEHASTYDGPHGERLLAARTRISYRLQDITGRPCLLQRYADVSPELVEHLQIRAVFISGHGAEPERYDPADQAGLRAVVAEGDVPVFGFCGGLQFVMTTLGAPVVRMGRIPEGDEDPLPDYAPGWIKEFGYHPVRPVGDHPLTSGLGEGPVFRHAHTWHVPELPPAWVRLAETDVCPVQLAAHRDRPLAGSQFHPEYWTDEAPEGKRLIENFCRWVGLID